MLLDAIDLPHVNSELGGDGSAPIVQGISIRPTDSKEYAERLKNIKEKCRGEKGVSVDTFLTEAATLSKFKLFGRCPRIVVIFTAPDAENVPPDITKRMQEVISKLCPNVIQVRFAVISETTSYFTLSMFLEGSVLECPDVKFSVGNYLWYNWCKSGISEGEFKEKLDSVLGSKKIVTAEGVQDFMLEEERFTRVIATYEGRAAGWNEHWRAFVDGLEERLGEARMKRLRAHAVASLHLTKSEIISALNYLVYVRHFSRRKPIEWNEEEPGS